MALPLQAEVHAAFLRFRDQHDHASLATVFDRTAQGLLLVASHLAGPGVDAEDLVQTTFMLAIRNAAAFDASRPLEPWLLGILTNEAHNARRKAGRRVDATRLPEEASDDPAVRAEEKEQAELLRRAIETMPEPTRSVLVLYLVHSMTPTEIAHALGHPVGSVKSWVHRGLDRLRNQLPVSLAMGSGVVAASSRWLQVREQVLAAGREAVEASVATAAGGVAAGATMATSGSLVAWLRIAVATLCVALPCWWYWSATAAVPRAGSPATASVEPRSAVGDRLATTTERPDDRAAVGAGEALAPTAELHVRVRWADGTPAVAGVGIAPRFASDARLRRRDVVTDAAGRAHLAGLAPGAVTIDLDRGLEREHVLLPGANFVEVQVPAGRSVHGRVVDDLGQPLAGATVWLTTVARRDDGWPLAHSGADGTFTLRDVPVGAALAAFADGFVPTRCATVHAAADPDVAIELAFERSAATVRIVVAGADGAPVADALVQVGGSEVLDKSRESVPTDDCRPPPPWLARTAVDGSVVCQQAAKVGVVAIYARGVGAAGTGKMWRAPGDAALQLALPSSRAFAGCVEGADAATAVCARSASVGEAAAAGAPAWHLPRAVVAPDGTFELVGVTTREFVAEARGPGGFALTERPAGSNEAEPWRAKLSQGRTLTGRVRGGDGSAYAGYRYQVCAFDDMHTGVLDDSGAFACAQLGDLVYELVVTEPEAVGDGIVLRRGGLHGGDALDLVVPLADVPAASARGRLLLPDGSPIPIAELVAFPRAFPVRNIVCDAEGRFEVGGLPAGSFLVLGGRYPYPLVTRFTLQAGEVADLGVVVAQPRAHCEVSIDPAMPRAGLETTLEVAGPPTSMVAVARWLGAPTTVTMPAPPGDYLLSIAMGGSLVHQQRVTLPSAATVAVAIPLPSGVRCTFEARLPAGEDCTWLRWRVVGEPGERELCNGPRKPGERLVWRAAMHLPKGDYRVVATSDRGQRGELVVRVGDDSAGPFVLNLR